MSTLLDTKHLSSPCSNVLRK